MGLPEKSDPLSVSLDYCDTVNSNIDLFLSGKSKKITVTLEHIDQGFAEFWNLINAEGDLNAALAEFNRKYNATKGAEESSQNKMFLRTLVGKLKRLVIGFPGYIKNA
jgi:hypothetical protein